MRTIAIVNQKGGCGKTTTAINLAALYARRGLRTLLIDMDPQAHCAAGLGVPESRIEYSIGDALLANHSNGFDVSGLVWEVARNLYLAPSTVMLSALEAPGGRLHQLPDKDRRLESLLKILGERFDRCLIDSPPTIGLLTFNAMRAAREALIPVETGFFSLRGAERQWATIQRLIAHIGRPIACHLLATLHNPESQLSCNILNALRRQFAGQILPVIVHEHQVLREAASFGQPVVEYAPQSKACQDFEALADWLEDHAIRQTVQIEVFDQPATPARGAATEPDIDTVIERAVCESDSPVEEPRLCDEGDGPTRGGGRAAELARRMHEISGRSGPRLREPDAPDAKFQEVAVLEQTVAEPPPAEPPPPDSAAASTLVPTEVEVKAAAAAMPPQEGAEPTATFGVRQIAAGVLFAQPGETASKVAIAGEFNYWSPMTHPLKLNDESGIYELTIELPPGRYQYRIVVDDEWVADPYNSQQQLNSYGEPNSVVIVT
ncbi:MAG: AAA family ATPase [Phycisphaerales bacterium]|nr:AAA family ATPase [Phycisphaerales bacterium]MCI0629894.1 AAA family ATPase [Phycisphaerales bacterium]MCI0675003.1 AAA family ATPase [Phycisphaerales bacterium]